MNWLKNYGILKFNSVGVDDFTSDKGLELRKKINPILRRLLKLAVKGELIVDRYPKLEQNKAYIFTSLHRFVEDAIANLSMIDRNAYLLFGTTDQLEVNVEMYAAWLNGFIYVNRLDPQSRQDAITKMIRVLNNGNSVLLYPEGGFNNTENLLCQKLFASPYILSKETGAEVVPIAPFYEFGSNKIFMNVGNPIDLSIYNDKRKALEYLRDILSTLMYENIERHSTPVSRRNLGKDPRMFFMRERCQEYLKTRWTRDVWEEELTRYLDKDDKEMLSVLESMDDIIITKENAKIMAPILVRRQENKKYNFKQYMHDNWSKIQ